MAFLKFTKNVFCVVFYVIPVFSVSVLLISFVFLQNLELPKVKGQLLVFGATNWDLIGRKEVPKQQGERGLIQDGRRC